MLPTGAATGVGAATARILGAAGAPIVGHYRAYVENIGAEGRLERGSTLWVRKRRAGLTLRRQRVT